MKIVMMEKNVCAIVPVEDRALTEVCSYFVDLAQMWVLLKYYYYCIRKIDVFYTILKKDYNLSIIINQ